MDPSVRPRSGWQHRQVTRVDGKTPTRSPARRDLSLVGNRVMLEAGDDDISREHLAATHTKWRPSRRERRIQWHRR